MPIQLNDFTEKKRVLVDGECKQIKSWAFKHPTYGLLNDTEMQVIFTFEDGTSARLEELEKVENCE